MSRRAACSLDHQLVLPNQLWSLFKCVIIVQNQICRKSLWCQPLFHELLFEYFSIKSASCDIKRAQSAEKSCFFTQIKLKVKSKCSCIHLHLELTSEILENLLNTAVFGAGFRAVASKQKLHLSNIELVGLAQCCNDSTANKSICLKRTPDTGSM